ncbi:N-acetyltransferase [Nitrosomonas sp.]|uniref:N-acetyltransferase n=1 Tax=Nitrosomonas sp. TaxID=42353 RepID=UPI0025FC8341|nr:N-acetyltransferase [Nitrosomonas sp.]
MSHIDVPASSKITVRPVMTYRDMGRFIDVPWHIYADDPVWVPPLRLERRFHFSRFNPYFKHGEWQGWIAYLNDQPAGRISAQIDTLHQQRYGSDSGHFGLMECIENSEVFAALIMHAEAWLASREIRRISGPFNFSINQDCGILVDGFDTPPAIMMPHSARWYGRLLEEQGYHPAKDLLAYKIKVEFEIPAVIQLVIKRFSPQIRMRTLQRDRFDEEMETLRSIFNDAWSENWGFIPFTQEEFAELGSSLRLLLPDDFIQIAEVDGKPAAFMVGLPNLNEVLKELNGNLFPFGWLKLINRIRNRQIRSGRIPLMGVRKQYHNTPIGLALACLVIDAPRQAGIARGIEEVELSWILEDNVAMRHILDQIGSEQYKRYRIYQKVL